MNIMELLDEFYNELLSIDNESFERILKELKQNKDNIFINKDDIINKSHEVNRDQLEDLINFLKTKTGNLTIEYKKLNIVNLLENKDTSELKIDFVGDKLIISHLFDWMIDIIKDNLSSNLSSITINDKKFLKCINSKNNIDTIILNFNVSKKEIEFIRNKLNIKKIIIANGKSYLGNCIKTNSGILFTDDFEIITNLDDYKNSGNKEEIIISNFEKNGITQMNLLNIFGHYNLNNIKDISCKAENLSFEYDKENKNIKDTEHIYDFLIKQGFEVKNIEIDFAYINESELYDYDYSKLDKIASDANIIIKPRLSKNKSKYEEFKILIDGINWYKKIINEYPLSPVEKLAFAEDILKTFIYKYSPQNEKKEEIDPGLSRDPISIMNTGYIVCVGYTSMMKQILSNQENIKFSDFGVKCFDDKKEYLGGHSRGIVRVDDDKYNIHGLYAIDPTWDSYREEIKEMLGEKYDSLISYKYFLIPFTEEYKKTFPNDNSPSIFSDGLDELNKEYSIEQIKKTLKIKNKSFSEDSIYAPNIKKMFGNLSDEKILNYSTQKRISFQTLLEIVKNVRLAEGYPENMIEHELSRVADYNKGFYSDGYSLEENKEINK